MIDHFYHLDFDRQRGLQEQLRESLVSAAKQVSDSAIALIGSSKKVAGDLDRKGYLARTVGIKLRFEDFRTVTRDRTLEAPTGAAQEIRRAAFECLSRIELKRRVRLIGVRLGELHKPGDLAAVPLQPDLLGEI